jgi:hypothetical protein
VGLGTNFAIELAIYNRHWKIIRLLMASCDYIPFRLFFLALCTGPVEDELVSLLCSKRIVADDNVSSSTFISLLSNVLLRENVAYVILLLGKKSPVSTLHFEPDSHWPEPSGQENLQIAKMLIDRGVILSNHVTQRVKLLTKKES